MDDITKVQEENLCTCDDEYTTTFCPIHPPKEVSAKKIDYGESDILIITDNDMSEQGYGYWEGYIFTCPSCGLDSIMVNPTMGGCCTNSECRRKVEVRSKTITAKIRSIQNVQNRS